MAGNAPIVRVDREALNELELFVMRQTLHRMADYINAVTKTGAIYGQIQLSPEEAAMKGGQ